MSAQLELGARPREWSSWQLAIFRDVADGCSHTVVRARAGTGKTTTIVEALSHVPVDEKSLFVAFNKSIADELRRRTPRGVDVKTLHGYGYSAVRKAYPGATVGDPDEHKVSKLAAKLFGPTYDPRHPSARPEAGDLRHALVKAVSFAKGVVTSLEAPSLPARIAGIIDTHQLLDLDSEITPIQADAIREALVRDAVAILRECADPRSTGTIDYDDMCWLPVVNNLRLWQYDRVFVDEVQDLNPVQIELALRAVKRSGRVCAIGDNRQSIYAFRGADANAMDHVVRRLEARVLPLSVTYRCASRIVEEARTIVADIEAPPGAHAGEVLLGDEDALRKHASPGDFVVSRTNAPLVGLCLAFLKEGRRAQIRGRDVGGSIAALVRKSGAADVPALVEYAEAYRARELEHLLRRDPPPEAAMQLVNDRADVVLALAEGASSVAEVHARIDALFSDSKDANRITLSSTHRVKGLESDRVWMLADTFRAGSVEEDNLRYVAITRAKRSLVYVRATGPSTLTAALAVTGGAS
jgi:DNA helicase II / ATP-dependent DNA helicase PcrA